MRIFTFVLLLGTFLSSGVLFAANPSVKKSAETDKSAQTAVKLDQILVNQKEILKQLAELKQELLIVKARATR